MPYRRYSTKRLRDATIEVIEQANEVIDEYTEQGYSLTLRQLYYKFVARDLFPDDRKWRRLPNGRWVKDPTGTKNADPNYDWLGQIINDGRLCGLVNWSAIVDRTRNLEQLPHWDSVSDILEQSASQYREDKWATQDTRVEVWVEKEALIGIFEGVCDELQVPYFACRGYVSQSTMWEAAQRFIAHFNDGYNCLILHFGDHDPSGIDMTRDIHERLNLTFGADVEVRRLGLTMAQIEEYDPPPNPTKLDDSRSTSYIEEYGHSSWELDALEPDVLTALVRDEIIDNVRNETKWEAAVEQEEAARQKLVELSEEHSE